MDAIVAGSEPSFRTISQVAEELQVSERQVRRWIEDGRLRAIRLGRLVRISPDEFARFVKAPSTSCACYYVLEQPLMSIGLNTFPAISHRQMLIYPDNGPLSAPVLPRPLLTA